MSGTKPTRRAAPATVLLALSFGLTGFPAHAGVDGEILYARSADGGATWEGHANLSADADESEAPHVAAAGDAVHVVWKEGDEGEVAYRRSTDGGGTFSPEANVSATPGDSAEADVAVAAAAVHIVWAEEIDGEDDVLHVASSDSGATFSDRVNVSDDPAQKSKDPDLVVAGAAVSVVYEHEVAADKEDIYFQRSGDGGGAWDDPVNVSRDADKSTEPAVAVEGEAVHVVWEARGDDADPADDRIAYARSSDGGASFSDRVLLPSDLALGEPAVAVAGASVHVASCSPLDETGVGISDLWYHGSADGGVTWQPPVNLSSNGGECDTPALAVAGSAVHVAWADSASGLPDILLRSSTDGGTTFGATGNVSATPGDSEDPSIALDATTGTLHITWTDSSGETPAPAPVSPAVDRPGAEGPTARARRQRRAR